MEQRKFPLTYESRRNGKLQSLVVVYKSGEWTEYLRDEIDTSENYPDDHHIFDDPKVGIGHLGVGNSQSEDVDPLIFSENVSQETIEKLIIEVNNTFLWEK